MVRYRGRSWRCCHAATGGGGLSGALRRGCRRSLYRRATGRELRAHRTRTAVCGAASGSGRPDRSIGRVEARGTATPGVTANGDGFWKDSEEIPKTGPALGAIVTDGPWEIEGGGDRSGHRAARPRTSPYLR